MLKAPEGSTRQLIQFCLGYFLFYIITGLSVKYFMGSPDLGLPGMSDLEYLVYGTLGAVPITFVAVLLFRWYKLESENRIHFLGLSLPAELLYIIPSGVCTAVIVPTTTLMYTLPISVMVAMVIMRGAVVIVSRIIDAIQIRQGILKKRVYAEENWAVLFAMLAVAVPVFMLKGGEFDFVKSPAAMGILGSYVLAYAIRIYIMNYFKNTASPSQKRDNKVFFGIEQLTSGIVIFSVGAFLYYLVGWSQTALPVALNYQAAIAAPKPLWGIAAISGTAFGVAAFFSVFLFMFKGRTATFAGLVNRLTSLIAGTTATLIFHFGFGGKFPKNEDWLSLAFILIAVGFLTRAEKKRATELVLTHEIEDDSVVTSGGTKMATA